MSGEGSGVAARDEALDRVAGNAVPWFDRARAAAAVAVRALPFFFTGEDVRREISGRVGEPHHPGAWGALVHRLLWEGLIEPTGRYVPMAEKSSHARRTPEYRHRTA